MLPCVRGEGSATSLRSLWQQGTPFLDLVLIVTLVSVETVFQKALFRCPCEDTTKNALYAGMFLVLPTVLLFITSVYSNAGTWPLAYGACRRKGSRTTFLRRRLYGACRSVLPRALLMPLVWLVYAFLNGEIYCCLMSESPCGCTEEDPPAPWSAECEGHHTTSQVIGISLAFVAIMTFVTVKCCIRLFTPKSYYKWKYDNMYEETVKNTQQNKMKEYIEKLVKQTLEDDFRDVDMESKLNTWYDPLRVNARERFASLSDTLKATARERFSSQNVPLLVTNSNDSGLSVSCDCTYSDHNSSGDDLAGSKDRIIHMATQTSLNLDLEETHGSDIPDDVQDPVEGCSLTLVDDSQDEAVRGHSRGSSAYGDAQLTNAMERVSVC